MSFGISSIRVSFGMHWMHSTASIASNSAHFYWSPFSGSESISIRIVRYLCVKRISLTWSSFLGTDAIILIIVAHTISDSQSP